MHLNCARITYDFKCETDEQGTCEADGSVLDAEIKLRNDKGSKNRKEEGIYGQAGSEIHKSCEEGAVVKSTNRIIEGGASEIALFGEVKLKLFFGHIDSQMAVGGELWSLWLFFTASR